MAESSPRGSPALPPVAAGFLRLITTRSVVRNFAAESIDDDLLEEMLKAMLAAPSGGNKQAWAFVVVRDPVRLRHIRAFCPGILGVPSLLLIACFDTSRATDEVTRRSGSMCIAMAVQNFLLAAHALGLGGCPVTSFRPNPVRMLTGLPAHLEPVLVVPAGCPAGKSEPTRRRGRREVLRHESWE
ncbi:nitroreductase family protein [Saccharothrix deserti]|uniref:nitroreductase family protein n=1 Tax=Saccharothrix deserti TaxID=2593674 RepID=UPI00131B954F|nr:nitroreductase family protein [Saccharothrix deserti]